MTTIDPQARLARLLMEEAPRGDAATGALQRALAEATARPGRFARAGLLLVSAEAAGMPAETAERLACAIEFWHLASLLLDDLPCMDNATERRGRACLHRVHGESTAILAALAFINRAYTLTGEVFASRSEPVRQEALALVETVMGPAGVVGGQAADLGFAHGPGGASSVSRIAWRKTGSLLWLSLALPAVWAEVAPAQRRALRRLAVYWGLAYQAGDDLSDVLGSAAQAGKTAQQDAALARPNLALALGVPAAQRRVARLQAQAQTVVARLVAENPRHLPLQRWHEMMFVASRAKRHAA